MVRIAQSICFCAALMVVANPATAGVEPVPFLNFNYVPDAGVEANFEVSLPAVPPNQAIPVEILSLSLTSTNPMLDMTLLGGVSGVAGGPLGSMGIVDFSLTNGTRPADGTSVMFDLKGDFLPFMGTSPVSGVDPTPFNPSPDSFDVLFDTLIPGGIVHHVMSFESMPGFMFSDIMVAPGSVLVGFTLTGPYTSAGPELFRATISGSAQPVPEPAPFALLVFGLAGLALARRRRAI